MFDTLKTAIGKRWNKSAPYYDKCPGHGILSEKEEKAWLEILENALGKKKRQKILDAGTGTGVVALLLAGMGHEVTGIDLSEDMMRKAGEKAAVAGLQIDFHLGDAEAPDFADGLFDVVISRHVVWTLPDPEKAVSAWKRLLKPGGRIVIIDGDWDRQGRGFWRRVWRYCAMPLIWMTEGRDPRRRGGELDRYFPMRRKRRPEADVELLRREDLEVSVQEISPPQHYTLLSFLKYGYSRGRSYQFVVQGMKTDHR